jgi:hypothetical protein
MAAKNDRSGSATTTQPALGCAYRVHARVPGSPSYRPRLDQKHYQRGFFIVANIRRTPCDNKNHAGLHLSETSLSSFLSLKLRSSLRDPPLVSQTLPRED